MVTVTCRNCAQEYELVYGSPSELAWCSDECRAEFERVVEHLVAGGDLEELGVDHESRLAIEALKESGARRRRDMVERREVREREAVRSRPRKMPPV
jgi:hypothetical protein